MNRYPLLFGVVIILVTSAVVIPVQAGILTGTRSVGEGGTTFTLYYYQGCPSQTVTISGLTATTIDTGPNTCAQTTDGIILRPFYCPIDSQGGRVGDELVQNCNECDCPYLHYCHGPTGECRACPALPTCPDDDMINTWEYVPTPGDPCNMDGECFYPTFDVTLMQSSRYCTLWCQPWQHQIRTFTLNTRGSSRLERQEVYHIGTLVCVHDVRTTHMGNRVECNTVYTWNLAGYACHFEDPVCYTDMVYVKGRCHEGSLNYNFQLIYPLSRGEEAEIYFDCELGWYSGSHKFTAIKSSDGSVSCTPPERISGFTTLTISECS